MTKKIIGGTNRYVIKHVFHIVTHGNYNFSCFFVIYIGVSLLFSVD